MPATFAAASGLLHAAAGIFLAGVQIAAPGLVATLVADVALGFLGKASPQLPVLFIGLAVKNLLGLAMLIVVVAYWPHRFSQRFTESIAVGEKRLLHSRTELKFMADQNKTEKATPRQRQKAREQGQIARSRDLVAGLGTMTAVMLLAWQLPAFAADWRGLLRHELDSAAVRPDQLLPVMAQRSRHFRGVALAASLSWLVATLGGVAQGGLVFAPAASLRT